MDTFSEKELDRLKKLEQLRRLLQTILGSHLRLFIAIFVAILVTIMLLVYFKATLAPDRYEAQAMLYYYPKQTKNIRSYDGKFVLQLLTRNAMRHQFFQDTGADPHDKRHSPNRIQITPIEKKRVLNCFKVTLHAADAKTAVAFTNAFLEHCMRTYSEDRSESLKNWKNVLIQKKADIFRYIRRLDQEKGKLGAPMQMVTPEKDYEQLRQLLSEQQTAHTKMSFVVTNLELRHDRLKKAINKINPALVANERAIREQLAALKQLDKDIMLAQELYTELNPRLIAMISRRKTLDNRLKAFLAENGIVEADLDSIDRADALSTELKTVDEELSTKRDEMRILERELAETNSRFNLIGDLLPRIQQINQQYNNLQESLQKLDESISEINYLMPLVKGDLVIGERAESARGTAPFSTKNIVVCLFAAGSLTGFLAALTVLLEFWFGKVASEKELSLVTELRYLGALPTSEALFNSKGKEQLAFNTIFHNFQLAEKELHIILAGTLPGGKILPELFDFFEWNLALSGKRMLLIDMVLATSFNDESFPPCDTGIVVYSGGKGYLPVMSKRFLSPSECGLLKEDLQILRKSYDFIFIKHSVSLRRDRMFIEQIVKLCDGALIAVGAKKTTRKYLRRLMSIKKSTQLPIMTILSDTTGDATEKSSTLEVEG